MQSLLLGALVLLIKEVPVYLRQHFGDKVDCGIYFFVPAPLYERYHFSAMWSKYLTQASDQILGKLRLPAGLIILASIPDRRKFSSALLVPEVRLLLCGSVPATS